MRGLHDGPDYRYYNEKGSNSKSNSSSDTVAEHDVAVLASIVFESVSAANIYDWYDKFREDCEPWHLPTPSSSRSRNSSGSGSSGSNKGDNNAFDFTNCRFVRALSDLESTGLIKVKNGGAEVQRITYLWMNQHHC